MPAQHLMVSNPSDGVVVITPDADRPKSYIRFEAKGDSEGGDSVYVSRETIMQAAFIKAIRRGRLAVEDAEGDHELERLLRVSAPPAARTEPAAALTVQNVVFDEDNDYKARTVHVPVVIDPLAKV